MLKDLYYMQLYKIYYKNVNNLLPAYFQTFTPNYNDGIDHNHDLRYNALRLPMTRKEYYVQFILFIYTTFYSALFINKYALMRYA